MSSVQSASSLMSFSPTGRPLCKAVKYLGYNWFLCYQHCQAIGKINSVKDKIFKSDHLWKKSYHILMIALEVVPVFGHIIAALEALLHRSKKTEVVPESVVTQLPAIDPMEKLEPVLKKKLEDWLTVISAVGSSFSPLNNPLCVIPEQFNHLKNQKWFASKVVQANGQLLQCLPDFQDDKSIVELAIKQDDEALFYSSSELKNDEDLCLKALEYSRESGASVFDFMIPKKLQDNEEFCRKAAMRNGYVFGASQFPAELKRNIQLITNVLESKNNFNFVNSPFIAQIIFNNLQSLQIYDPKLMKLLVSKNGTLIFMNSELSKNEEFILTAIKQDFNVFEHISPEITTREFNFKALEANFRIAHLVNRDDLIEYLKTTDVKKWLKIVKHCRKSLIDLPKHFNKIPKRFKNHASEEWFAKKLIGSCGGCMLTDLPDFQGNVAIVDKAIKNNHYAIKFVDNELKTDTDFLLRFLMLSKLEGGKMFDQYIPKKFKRDRDFCLKALGKNPFVFEGNMFPQCFRDDKIMVSTALTSAVSLHGIYERERIADYIFDNLSADLKNDEDILKLFISIKPDLLLKMDNKYIYDRKWILEAFGNVQDEISLFYNSMENSELGLDVDKIRSIINNDDFIYDLFKSKPSIITKFNSNQLLKLTKRILA